MTHIRRGALAVAAVAVLVAIAATLGTTTSGAAKVTPHVASCANSFPGDGHAGPWWDPTPGGVHGNTVSVDCPNGSTHWDLNYKIQFGCGSGCWSTWFNQHRSGNGSPSDFGYLVPTTCDGGLHAWRTHVDNNVTGGNINKPSGGSGVFLSC